MLMPALANLRAFSRPLVLLIHVYQSQWEHSSPNSILPSQPKRYQKKRRHPFYARWMGESLAMELPWPTCRTHG